MFVGLGVDAEMKPASPMLIVSDSLLPPTAATDQADTLEICSPHELVNTDVAMETLKDLDDYNKSVEEKVWDSKSIYTYKKKSWTMNGSTIHKHAVIGADPKSTCTVF